jgi:hypothetical protein
VSLQLSKAGVQFLELLAGVMAAPERGTTVVYADRFTPDDERWKFQFINFDFCTAAIRRSRASATSVSGKDCFSPRP